MERPLFFTVFVILLQPMFSFDYYDVPQKPTVVVSVLVRNKAHVLPYFLGSLENLDFPKDRMVIHMQSDHNSDSSAEILDQWKNSVDGMYSEVILNVEHSPARYKGEVGVFDWPRARMRHVIEARESALNFARHRWADYLLSLDVDNILVDERVLLKLIDSKRGVVAPMLTSTSRYSNFWAGMTEAGFYKRTDDYDLLLSREKSGVHPVNLVSGTVLIDLRLASSRVLTYKPENLDNYRGPHDDIITFAHSVYYSGQPSSYLLNVEYYGIVLPPMEVTDTLEDDKELLEFVLTEALKDGPPGLIYSPAVPPIVPPASKLGFSEIYLINLDRRPDRLVRMDQLFNIIGLSYNRVSAVDGETVDDAYLEAHGIHFLPGYEDPYHKRPMKKGEIGCFLSHYHIWNEVAKNGLDHVLVFEDDLRFVFGARNLLKRLHSAVVSEQFDYDLLYLGRKRLSRDIESKTSHMVQGSDIIATVGYTYWTLGYMLSRRGAQKLLDANPLENLLPVDEFLPIMFDQHPNGEWKRHFPKRNLLAFTSEPLVVHPSHYTNEPGYISDTEASAIVPPVENSQSTKGARGDSGQSSLEKDEL